MSMAAVAAADGPPPREDHGGVQQVSGPHEKGLAQAVINQEDDSDDSSQFKQDGVRQVEAVTQVWSRATMWTVFVLCVSRPSRFPMSPCCPASTPC